MSVKTLLPIRGTVLVVAIALLAGKLAGGEPAGSKTEFLSLFESRGWHDKSGYPPGQHHSTVFVRVHNAAQREPAGYANVSIDEAVDDAGTSLVDLGSGLARGLSENAKVRLLSPLEVAAGADPSIIMQFQLLPGDRKATKIVRLRGHVQVCTGGDSVVTILIPKIGKRNFFGSEVTNPALQKQRLKLRLGGYETADGKGVVNCALGGNVAAVKTIRIRDSDGATLAQSPQDPHGLRFNDRWQTRVGIPRPPDDRMTLEIDVVQNQKVVTVPFELHDVELP